MVWMCDGCWAWVNPIGAMSTISRLGSSMGLSSRRLAKLDQARLDLFTLARGEFPVESQAAKVTSVWPAPLGMPLSPSQADKIKVLMDGWGSYLPLMVVIVLTDSHLRWTPHRTYRGRRIYPSSKDNGLAEGEPVSKGIYSKFPHPSLGERAVPLRHIQRFAIEAYWPDRLVLVNVHLTGSGAVEGYPGWPAYELEHLGAYIPLPADESPESGEVGPYLQFWADGAMSLTFSTLLAQGLQALDIPIQTDMLSDEERAMWAERSSGVGMKRPWRPLSQRLRQP